MLAKLPVTNGFLVPPGSCPYRLKEVPPVDVCSSGFRSALVRPLGWRVAWLPVSRLEDHLPPQHQPPGPARDPENLQVGEGTCMHMHTQAHARTHMRTDRGSQGGGPLFSGPCSELAFATWWEHVGGHVCEPMVTLSPYERRPDPGYRVTKVPGRGVLPPLLLPSSQAAGPCPPGQTTRVRPAACVPPAVRSPPGTELPKQVSGPRTGRAAAHQVLPACSCPSPPGSQACLPLASEMVP